VVEASSDLRSWTVLGSVVSTNGVIRFSDEGAAGLPQRYYRVVAGKVRKVRGSGLNDGGSWV